MAKIMDPILPIPSLFWDIGPFFWALLQAQVEARAGVPVLSVRGPRYDPRRQPILGWKVLVLFMDCPVVGTQTVQVNV